MIKPHKPSPPTRSHGRGASRYRRSETTRLLRAAADAGLTVRGIEADPVTGSLRILVGKDDEKARTTARQVIETADQLRKLL
jgi:hypothetical protein